MAGDGNGLAVALSANEHRLERAKRVAKRTDGRRVRAKALRRVAAQSDRGLDAFAELIPVVPPQVQGLVVDGAELSAAIRAQVIDLLVSIAAQLPEPARTAVLEAVAQFQVDGDVEALVAALSSPDVIAAVKPMISELIGEITTHVQAVLDQLEGLLGTLPLPPEAAAAISAAIAEIDATLTQVLGMVEELIGGLLSGDLGGSLGPGLVCDLLAGLPLPVPLPICG